MADLHDPHFRPSNDGDFPDMPHVHPENTGVTPIKVSRKDRAWMVARRVGKGALSGAASAFVPTLIATRDIGSAVIASAYGAVVGGVGMGSEKLIKENRKAAGKPSLATVAKEVWEAIRAIYDYIKANKAKKS